MEPPVSDPVAAKQSPAATEDADPPEDPPGTKSLSLFFDFNGFITLPKNFYQELLFIENLPWLRVCINMNC